MPFAAKFGLNSGDLTDLSEDDLDRAAQEYAKYFGHDPAGNWILVVHLDNTSEMFRFDTINDMWCCRPDRQRHYQMQSKVFAAAFPDHHAARAGARHPER